MVEEKKMTTVAVRSGTDSCTFSIVLFKTSDLFNKWLKFLEQTFFSTITISFITKHLRGLNSQQMNVIGGPRENRQIYDFRFFFVSFVPLVLLNNIPKNYGGGAPWNPIKKALKFWKYVKNT